MGLQIAIIAVVTFLICTSVYRGLDKGILIFSNINAGLALLFITFVLFVGPTVFILEMGITTLGSVLREFITYVVMDRPSTKI